MQVDALLVSSVRVEVNVEGSQEHRSAVGGRQLGVVMTFEEMELKLNLLKNWFISFSNITSPTDSFLTFLLWKPVIFLRHLHTSLTLFPCNLTSNFFL